MFVRQAGVTRCALRHRTSNPAPGTVGNFADDDAGVLLSEPAAASSASAVNLAGSSSSTSFQGARSSGNSGYTTAGVTISAATIPQDQQQVDPFRIGYNMGTQNVHLETLRTKLDDNLELLKSHFHSLRESNKTNYDGMRRLHLEYNKQFTAELQDGTAKMFAKLEFVEGQLARDRETMREMSKQQWESMQKHFDDRLENIKDTVKVTGLLLVCINAVILFMVNNQQQLQYSRAGERGGHTTSYGEPHAMNGGQHNVTGHAEVRNPGTPWYKRLLS
jgi:hypothetical protein